MPESAHSGTLNAVEMPKWGYMNMKGGQFSASIERMVDTLRTRFGARAQFKVRGVAFAMNAHDGSLRRARIFGELSQQEGLQPSVVLHARG